MIRLLRFLITGDWHLHEWEDAEQVKHYDPDYNGPQDQRRPVRITQVCKCKICGSRKKFELT